jgi:hypothetical protein
MPSPTTLESGMVERVTMMSRQVVIDVASAWRHCHGVKINGEMRQSLQEATEERLLRVAHHDPAVLSHLSLALCYTPDASPTTYAATIDAFPCHVDRPLDSLLQYLFGHLAYTFYAVHVKDYYDNLNGMRWPQPLQPEHPFFEIRQEAGSIENRLGFDICLYWIGPMNLQTNEVTQELPLTRTGFTWTPAGYCIVKVQGERGLGKLRMIDHEGRRRQLLEYLGAELGQTPRAWLTDHVARQLYQLGGGAAVLMRRPCYMETVPINATQLAVPKSVGDFPDLWQALRHAPPDDYERIVRETIQHWERRRTILLARLKKRALTVRTAEQYYDLCYQANQVLPGRIAALKRALRTHAKLIKLARNIGFRDHPESWRYLVYAAVLKAPVNK